MEGCGSELLRVQLRWMTEEDLESVFTLERNESTHPWDAGEMVDVLKRPGSAGMVVEYNQTPIGFIVYEQTEEMLDIHNIVVKRDFQRRGVGSQMIARVACRLGRNSREMIRLAVRETNLNAQLFFRSLGFTATAIEHSEFDTDEDSYIMQYRHRSKMIPTELVLN